MIEINKIHNEDCKETLSKMDNEMLDLTITSPPYNVNLGDNKYNKSPYDLYNDNKEHIEYINWLQEIFALVYQKTKRGGRCVINIGDGKNGAVPTHADIIHFMTKQLGWIPMATILWDKKNVSNRTSWGSYKSPSQPSFPKPFEYILVFAKEDRKLQSTGETDLTSDEFIKWSLALWEFPGEHSSEHPAAFPEQLPERCIKMLSWKGSLIYDPFMGSGTTAVVSKKLHRNFIGSEISKQYLEMANKRLAETHITNNTFF